MLRSVWNYPGNDESDCKQEYEANHYFHDDWQFLAEVALCQMNC